MTNVAESVKRRRENERIRSSLVKKKVIAHMGHQCHDCRGVYPDPVYDFHHLNPEEKERHPSYYFRKGFDFTMQKLSNCIMLCANCHRIRHWSKE